MLENVPHILEKNVYSVTFGWNVLLLSQSDLMCHERLMFLIDFLPGYLSINVCRILKSLTITVFLSISPFRSFDICYIYIGAPMLDI